MKTMVVIILMAFIQFGECLIAQEDLVVRELTTRSEGSSTLPSRDVLREYDQQQRLISETRLLPTLDKQAWRYDSRMSFEYNDLDQLIHQTKTFYSVSPERITTEDEIFWEYDQAGKQVSYKLLRDNFDRGTEEGFWYTYEYDQNGCQSARTGKTWDSKLQQFVLNETTTIENTTTCLPLKISSGEYLTRYEYEYDAEGQPISERTYQAISGEPEELISVFTLTCGTNYEKRVFHRMTNDYQYSDSVAYDEAGNSSYRLERSNLYTGDDLEPVQEYFWEYDVNGTEIVRVKNQSWNDLLEFWQTTTIDSTIELQDIVEEVHVLQNFSSPGILSRSSTTRNVTTFRCDDLPVINIEGYEKDGVPLALSFFKEIIYAGPAACNQFVDLDQLEVYPVPASDALHIRSPLLGAGAAKVRLLDMMGQTVRSETYEYANGTILDLNGLTDGVYTVMVDFNKFVLSKKVLIQTP